MRALHEGCEWTGVRAQLSLKLALTLTLTLTLTCTRGVNGTGEVSVGSAAMALDMEAIEAR